MPDQDGKLSKEEADKIVAQIVKYDQERGHDLKCEVCGTDNWTLDDSVLELKSETVHGVFGPYRYVRLVAIYCLNCGNTKLFPAAVFGIKPLDRPRRTKKKKAEKPEEPQGGEDGDQPTAK